MYCIMFLRIRLSILIKCALVAPIICLRRHQSLRQICYSCECQCIIYMLISYLSISPNSVLHIKRLSVGHLLNLIRDRQRICSTILIVMPEFRRLRIIQIYTHFRSLTVDRLGLVGRGWLALRKYAYSNILKISPPKTEIFLTKILIFFIFLLKI